MRYSESELREAVATSTSRRQVLDKLGINSSGGGNYKTLNKKIKHLNIDVSHLKGQAWSKDSKIGPKRELQLYLDNEVPIQSNKLRKRLILDGIFTHECSSCHGSTWLNQPIPLELDHINGDNQDNSLANLRLLCPNCHAFTPTYRGKNKKRQS